MASKSNSVYAATGRALEYLGDLPETVPFTLAEIKMKFSVFEVFCVIKLASAEGPQVAFCTAENPARALRIIAAKLRDGTLKTRPDKPFWAKVDDGADSW